MIQIHSIKSRCGSQSETENYHHVVENHVVEIHVSQGIAVHRSFFIPHIDYLGIFFRENDIHFGQFFKVIY